MREEYLKGWNIIWWLFRLFGLPITIPWLLYHAFDIMQQKRKKVELNGKVVMITGASSGLGEALAHIFYACGCKVILVARRKEELDRVKSELLKTHHTVPTYSPVVVTLDLSDINSLEKKVADIIENHDKIDILINNAGISYRGEVVTTSIDVDMKIMLINYFAQIALTKAVLPCMIRQQSGHLIYISSVQGKIAIPYRSAYSASKHALQAWCDSSRAELAGENIKITVISPGYIKTALSLNAITASGQAYGVMDKTTEQGYLPKYVAEHILKAILRNEKDVIISPLTPKYAILLRTLWPSLYFWIMQKRAKNIEKQD